MTKLAPPRIAVLLASLSNTMTDGVDVVSGLNKNMGSLAIMHDKTVMICDMRENNHVAWYCEMQVFNLGHTIEAIGTTAMIDIP